MTIQPIAILNKKEKERRKRIEKKTSAYQSRIVLVITNHRISIIIGIDFISVLGESCTSLGECYLDFNQNRAICMNGLCTCDWQYVQVNDALCEQDLKGQSFVIPSK